MITSIKFTKTYGFLTKKVEKPRKPTKNGKFRDETPENYQERMEEYNRELGYYELHKGEYLVPCANKLIGRTFTFVSDKINLIFGPNASGKTTILKCLAHQQLIGDGFMSLKQPLDFRRVKIGEEMLPEHVKDMVEKDCPTSCKVVMDGAPIYWHNFSSRTHREIGDLVGSVFSSIGEELTYAVNKGQKSSSQNQFLLLYKLSQIMSRKTSVDKLFKETIDSHRVNSTWQKCYEAQYNYFSSFKNANGDNVVNTFLFDEIDASMDILNIVELYTNFLPQALEKYGQQIIIISHSPVVLSNAIYGSDKYNVISMDEEYTQNCLEKLKQCW